MNGRVLAALIGLACCFDSVAGLFDTADAAKEHAEKGVQCAAAGNLVCAEAELRQAVELAPTDASYLTSLGGICGMEQKLDQAEVYFERAVNSDPNDAAARRNLAANQWRLGQFKHAQANLERLLRAKPQDKTATLLLGMVSENEHDYARAGKLLDAVPELVEQRPESMGALASSYYHTGHREEAHKVLESLVGRPAAPEGIFAVAGVAAQAEDYGIAEELFLSIRSTYPNAASVEHNLALIQFRTQRIAQSEKTLLDVVNTGRATGDIYDLLGWCYQKENNPTDAARAMENAIRLAPAEESYYRDLVTILMSMKKLAAALAVARQSVQAFPQSELAYCAKGMVEMKMDQFTDAAGSYSRAVQLSPQSIDAKLGLASAKWRAGMRAKAEAELEALLKQHPRDANVYETYGTLLLESATDDAMQERAARLLKKEIALDSTRPEAHYQLGMLDLEKGETGVSAESLRLALDELQTAARFGLNESKIHYALARVYRRLGRENEAAAEMRLYQESKATEDNLNAREGPPGTQGK